MTITYSNGMIILTYGDGIVKNIDAFHINRVIPHPYNEQIIYLLMSDDNQEYKTSNKVERIAYADVDQTVYTTFQILVDEIEAYKEAYSVSALLYSVITGTGELNVSVATTISAAIANANYRSPEHFSATYASSTTFTISTLPFTVTSEQLEYVKVKSALGVTTWYFDGVNGIELTISSNIVSMSGKTDPFASGDLYYLGIHGPEHGFDYGTDQFKNSVNTVADLFADNVPLVTAQDLTASYADFGSEIPRDNAKKLGIWIIADCNDSQDVDLKALAKHESGGTDEFEIDGVAVKRLWSGTGTDFKKYYEFDFGVAPIIQLQAIAGTLGATAGDLTISYTKIY